VAKRAEREAKVAARLSHPGIVALYEAGRDDEAVYLVSELVRGRTLARLMDEGGLSDRDVCELGAALCDALAHAHQRGVVHRDVKPGNVIVPDRAERGAGIAKLTDFGIARLVGEDALTRTGDIVGTLAYMAPEQAEGREAGQPADLYALALVLYEALSGVNPVRGRTPASTIRRVGVRLPPLERLRRDLPVELCRAIDRGVAARPEDRGKLKDLRRALSAARGEVGEETGVVEPGALEAVTRVTRMVAAARPAADRVARLDGDLAGEPWLEDDAPRGRATPSGRLGAALGAGALAAAALAWLGPEPPVPALGGAVLAAAVVAVLPRVGWVALAAAIVAWLVVDPEGTTTAGGGGLAEGSGGLVLLVALAAVPALALLWRDAGTWLSAPALAPVLGLVALAGAFPALAGQARSALTRAALGALGLWWLLLAELVTGKRLLLGAPPDATPRPAWAGSVRETAEHALAPVLTGGALGIAVLWALAAAVLPVVVRGRAAAVDLVAAGMWAAGLAAGTGALAGALGWAAEPRGLVAGAIAGGAVAVAARAWRGAA
jgi:hypothetical protein